MTAPRRLPIAGAIVAFLCLLCTADVADAQRKNLGDSVNSQWTEIIPIISADGRTLFLDRKKYPRNTGGATDPDDIWYSELRPDSLWSFAKPIRELNTRGPNAIFSILPDNNTALYWGARDSTGQIAFSIVHRTRTGWTAPSLLHVKKFYNRADGITASLAPDGRTLLMSVRRDDSPSGMNLYVSFLEDVEPANEIVKTETKGSARQREAAAQAALEGTPSFFMSESNEWTEPKGLGPKINTRYGETSPLLAADGTTLFFSSGRPGGPGEVNIWKANRLDSTWQHWSDPELIGGDFNIPGENYLNSITASGDYAYLTGIVENPEKNMDVFRIRVPEAFRIRPVVLLAGHVYRTPEKKSKAQPQPLAARLAYERLSDGKQLGIAYTNPANGAFQIALPGGEEYGVRVESDSSLPVSDHLDFRTLIAYAERTKDFYLPMLAVGSNINLNNIFFEFSKAQLNPASFAELNRFAVMMRKNPSLSVLIEGHTDDVGSEEANDQLSLARAQAVKNYLVTRGTPATHVSVKGFGKRQPVAANDSDEGRSKNRRVVVRVVGK